MTTSLRLPHHPVERALLGAAIAGALAKGLLFSVSILFFTGVLGLSAVTVGLGLTVGGAVGVGVSFAAGELADRVGAGRVLIVATVASGLSLAGYLLARGAVAFILAACTVFAAQAAQRTAQNAVIATAFDGPPRVAVRARLRVVTNVFIAVGTGVAGLALVIGTAAAYLTAMLAAALLVLASAVPVRRLAQRTEPDRPRAHTPVASPLRDRTYVLATALNAVMTMQFGLLTVGVPLWVVTHTRAPAVTVAAVLVVNTALVAAWQGRAARAAVGIEVAGRSVLRAAALLVLACACYASAAGASPALAVAAMLLGAVAHTGAEVMAEAGAWTLAFDLADPDRAGAYQGVSQAGAALGGMLAPAVVTATAISHGLLGWAVLAVVFLGAGGGTLALTAGRPQWNLASAPRPRGR